ncbi:hypothetical protein BV25DRAFT_1918730 [Artomyces pyxidatus]|uniref:Uncharacterized protein n=1 Tax=Artomyces pyxidatus TaxID=48021 RepID=A0ACB8SRQ0_9AGAM|nr:hypothetical protein BV25DRAFT_1918730 [Artomyces pyxidatus]
MTLDLWHQRMGHISYDALKRYGAGAVKGLTLDSSVVPSTPCPASAKPTNRGKALQWPCKGHNSHNPGHRPQDDAAMLPGFSQCHSGSGNGWGGYDSL